MLVFLALNTPFSGELIWIVIIATIALLFIFMGAKDRMTRIGRLSHLAKQLGTPGEQGWAFDEIMRVGGEEGVRAFLQVLSAPRGRSIHGIPEHLAAKSQTTTTFKSQMMNATWDGDVAYLLAVEGLGRMKAKEAAERIAEILRQEDSPSRPADWQLLAIGIWALGQIEEHKTAAAVIPFLGVDHSILMLPGDRINKLLDLKATDEFRGIHMLAADCLLKLGEGDLVEAFFRVIFEGKQTNLRILNQRLWRNEVIQALIHSLHSRDVARAMRAVKALGELNAIEALPELRQRTKLLDLHPRLQEAVVTLVRKLEACTDLPRPVDATTGDSQSLPRRSSGLDSDAASLPRPATEDHQ